MQLNNVILSTPTTHKQNSSPIYNLIGKDVDNMSKHTVFWDTALRFDHHLLTQICIYVIVRTSSYTNVCEIAKLKRCDCHFFKNKKMLLLLAADFNDFVLIYVIRTFNIPLVTFLQCKITFWCLLNMGSFALMINCTLHV